MVAKSDTKGEHYDAKNNRMPATMLYLLQLFVCRHFYLAHEPIPILDPTH